MKKLARILGLVILLLGFIVGAQNFEPLRSKTSAQVTEPDPGAGGTALSECSLIGNNSAAFFGQDSGKEDYSEAAFTLAMIEGLADAGKAAGAINGSSGTVIVRLVHGNATQGPSASEYAQTLVSIAKQTDKNFVATAGHNEPNCAGHPEMDDEAALAQEKEFIQAVIDGVGAEYQDQITFITGQLAYGCGVHTQVESRYFLELSALPGIEGVALHYYVGDTGSSAAVNAALANAISLTNGKPIWITESGPFKSGDSVPSDEEFRDYLLGIQQVLSNPNYNIQALLLFNAFGINKFAEANGNSYEYTRRFWNAECRAAMRESCNDIETVMEACADSEDDSAKDKGESEYSYHLEPIKGVLDWSAIVGTIDEAKGTSLNYAVMTGDKNKGMFRESEATSRTDFETSKASEFIFKDLMDQGYEVSCAMPSILFEVAESAGVENLIGSMRFLDDAKINFEIAENIKFVDALTPMWRLLSENGVYLLHDKNSLEAFWGAHDTLDELDEPLTQSIKSSAIYSLLTLEGQCQKQIDILSTIVKKCEHVDGDCPLDTELITEAGQNLGTTLDLAKKLNITQNSSDYSFCSQFYQRGEKMADTDLDTALALHHVPLYLPSNYRFAFVVLAAELYGPDEEGDRNNQGEDKKFPKFNFLRKHPIFPAKHNKKPRHEVRVIAFKIPDIGTNRNYTGSDETVYSDVLQLTRDALLTPDQQANLAQNRADYFNPDNIADYEDPYIDCAPNLRDKAEGAESGEDTFIAEACTKPAIAALIKMVNETIRPSEVEHCKLVQESYSQAALEPEANQYIYDQARIDEDASADHQDIETFGGDTASGDTYHALMDQWVGNDIRVELPRIPEFRFMSTFRFKTQPEDPQGNFSAKNLELNPDASDILAGKITAGQDGDKAVYWGPGQTNDPEMPELEKLTPSSEGSSEEPIARINAYLIAPQGYELKTVENVLYGTLTALRDDLAFNYDPDVTKQSPLSEITNTETADEIKPYGGDFDLENLISGVTSKFFQVTEVDFGGWAEDSQKEIKMGKKIIEDGCRRACIESYYQSLNTGELTDKDQCFANCPTGDPAVTVTTDQNNDSSGPRLLGALLGGVTRYIQRVINPVDSAMQEYIDKVEDTDRPTENFLLSFGGLDKETGEFNQADLDEGEVTGDADHCIAKCTDKAACLACIKEALGLKCEPAINTTYCDPDKLATYFEGDSQTQLYKGSKASFICKRESGGVADITNPKGGPSAFRGNSSYAVGLFQINIANSICGYAFKDSHGNSGPLYRNYTASGKTYSKTGGDAGYSALNTPLTIDKPGLLNACIAEFQDPERNTNYMVARSSNGENWSAWQIESDNPYYTECIVR